MCRMGCFNFYSIHYSVTGSSCVKTGRRVKTRQRRRHYVSQLLLLLASTRFKGWRWSTPAAHVSSVTSSTLIVTRPSFLWSSDVFIYIFVYRICVSLCSIRFIGQTEIVENLLHKKLSCRTEAARRYVSLKTLQNHATQSHSRLHCSVGCKFLLVFYYNWVFILYCLRDEARYWSKITISHTTPEACSVGKRPAIAWLAC